MKILVTGASGLVGSHFIENYSNKEATILSPSTQELDITNKQSVSKFFAEHNPDTIIHFAAYTDVSKSEQERDNKQGLCWIINAEGTANLVNTCSPNTYFIHISTDVVFSGHKDNPGPYSEEDEAEKDPKLLSWYGWTKREAEIIVLNHLGPKVILRISNPVRAKYRDKLDYARKILNLYDTNKLYPMFDDQFLTLTFIDEVTETLKILINRKSVGIFHVSSTNLFTPHKLANYLIEKARGVKEIVQPNSIETYLKDNPGRYPQYGGLKVEQTQQRLGINFKTWEEIIDSLIKQLSA